MRQADSGHPYKWLIAAALALPCLYAVWVIYLSGQVVAAVLVLGLFCLGFYTYTISGTIAYRYLFPGLAGMAVFVVFPLVFTIQIGFTNYSSANLLSFERATAYLLEQTYTGDGDAYTSSLHSDGAEFRLRLVPRHEDEDEQNPEKAALLQARTFVSPALALLSSTPPSEIHVGLLKDANIALGEPLSLSEVIRHREVLSKLRVVLPDGKLLAYAGLREFGPRAALFRKGPDKTLTNVRTGTVYHPDFGRGFYIDPQGASIEPGFTVGIGMGNYARMFEDREFRGPFFKIFLWTVAFAGLTVAFTLVVGCTLAVLLNWEALHFRTAYRTLLFLPYAVPGFISILVFKGLFNQNFGEINLILHTLFGIKPAWFADPFLAKVMLLLVNTWLGYPYVMVLCTGLIKSIPADLYEASAIERAGPLTNFLKITAPLILKPLAPLLIASFAFNFNNFVLISLLTGGRPDFLNTRVPAGTTDILVSYTYRIAFQDSGQNFGLAAAISTVVFILIALLSMANLRLMRVNQRGGS